MFYLVSFNQAFVVLCLMRFYFFSFIFFCYDDKFTWFTYFWVQVSLENTFQLKFNAKVNAFAY